jgi:hypothetical protein
VIEKRFCGVQRLGLGVARRRRAVEQVEVQRPVRHALAQHVDDAALADLDERRVRNLRRLMSLVSFASAIASFLNASGCVARRKAKSCGTSSAWARS